MEAGYFKAVITPPVGVSMAGYFLRDGVSKGILDELYVRALVLRDGAENLAIICLDLLEVPQQLSNRIAKLISDSIGLDRERIAIVATHTHSGPDISGFFGEVDECLVEEVARKAAGAVTVAFSEVSEVKLFYSMGMVDKIIVNRRDPSRGLKDPRIHVFDFRGRNRVILFNYSCHPVVLGPNNNYISADFPGYANSFVEQSLNANSMFINGCCGDINPLTPGTDISKVYDRSVGRVEDLDWMGRVIGSEVVKCAELASEVKAQCLKLAHKEVSLRVKKPYTISEAREAYLEAKKRYEEATERGLNVEEAKFKYLEAKNILRLTIELAGRENLKAFIQAIRLGLNEAIVFLPSEVITEVGSLIKSNSPFKNTVVASYSNDYFGYVLTRSEYARGGYEATFPYMIAEEGSGEKLVDAALSLLDELKR